LLTPGGTGNLLFVFTFSTSRNWMELGKRWTSIQGPYFSGDFNTSENICRSIEIISPNYDI
jgi:hypothetical protein